MLNTQTKKSSLTKKMMLSVFIIMFLLLVSDYLLMQYGLNKFSDHSIKQELYSIAMTASHTIINSSQGDLSYDENTGEFKAGNQVINKDATSLNQFMEKTGYGLAFYYQDISVYTNVTDENGKSTQGNKAKDSSIWPRVSKGETVYVTKNSLKNIPHEIIYMPLYQPSDNSVCGMISVGKPLTDNKKLKLNINIILQLALLFLIAVGIILQILCFSPITRSIKKLNQQVFEIVEDIKSNNGDLTKRIHFKSKDEIGSLAESINSLLEQLQDVMKNVISGSNQLSSSIDKTVESIQDSSQNATSVSGTMEELSANMEEVATAIETFTIGSKNMAEFIQKMKAEAEKGNDFTEDMQVRATSIHESTKNAYNTVQQTSASIKSQLKTAITESHKVDKINELTDEILNISSQTNLLALNASIEAARAGELGKGFAVVAEEIRSLADNSRETANKIQDVSVMVVTAVNQLASSSNEMLQFVSDKILSDYDMFKQTIEQYQNDAVSMNQIISEFATNTNQIDVNAQQMNLNITEISASAEQSAVGIENIVGSVTHLAEAIVQIHQNADDIRSVAEMMEEYIVRFKKF